tara:strand:+ start:23594 stop:24304 length:711 start_codon:yes stop_codon:yes gene_type:complete
LKKQTEIDEKKIRVAMWELKSGKTKKQACATLGIAYNTKRLTKIIDDFKNKDVRDKELREKAKTTKFTDSHVKNIIQSYTEGDSVTAIADLYHVSFTRIKKVLLDNNVPLRARGKKAKPKTEHIIQDLDVKLIKGDKVFVSKKNCYGIVEQVFDEDYIEEMSDGYSKAVYIRDNIYEEYWVMNNKMTSWKTRALEHHLKSLENLIVETGRECYQVYCNDIGFLTTKRENLFPVRTD